jgi:hypothetical protein
MTDSRFAVSSRDLALLCRRIGSCGGENLTEKLQRVRTRKNTKGQTEVKLHVKDGPGLVWTRTALLGTNDKKEGRSGLGVPGGVGFWCQW